MKISAVFVVVAAGSAAAFASAAAGQTFQGLGHLPSGDRTAASGISADGTAVVGWARTSAGNDVAFRWTQTGGLQSLGTLSGGTTSLATDTSADGSVVVGWGEVSNGSVRAFRWTEAGGLVILALQPGWRESDATAVSADGATICGTIVRTDDYTRGVRWSGTAVADVIDPLPGSYWVGVNDASADCSVLCGDNGIPFMSDEQTFRWTAASGIEAIVPERAAQYAGGISGDGGTIVGRTSDAAPYRWTHADGMDVLPLPPVASIGWANAASFDGSVIVGTASHMFDSYAVLWREGSLVVMQEELGGLVPDGWILRSVVDVSADGRTLVGNGTNPAGQTEAWIATLPEPCGADFDGDGTLTLADFVAFRNLYIAGDLAADFDGSGDLTLNDFTAFRNAYLAGCP